MPDVCVMQQRIIFRQSGFQVLTGLLGSIEDADKSAEIIRLGQRLRIDPPAFVKFQPNLSVESYHRLPKECSALPTLRR